MACTYNAFAQFCFARTYNAFAQFCIASTYNAFAQLCIASTYNEINIKIWLVLDVVFMLSDTGLAIRSNT
jgi:hypothetical protein